VQSVVRALLFNGALPEPETARHIYICINRICVPVKLLDPQKNHARWIAGMIVQKLYASTMCLALVHMGKEFINFGFQYFRLIREAGRRAEYLIGGLTSFTSGLSNAKNIG